MKEYFVLTIKDNNIVFNYRTIDSEEKNYVNKNSFYNDSLFCTLNYYKKSYSNIFKLIQENYKCNTLTVVRLVTFKYAVMLVNNLKLEYLRLDFASTMSLDDYNLFLDSDYIKKIDCYYMPNFIKKKFEKKGVEVNNYNKVKIMDRFMLQQDDFDYETLYYKKNIEIKEEYPNLISDIKEFLRINYNLKSIHLYIFSKDIIKAIYDLVKQDESRNIIIFLHQAYDKGNFIQNNFQWLKSLNENAKDTYTGEFRIIYSNKFIGNNLFKQLTFNNLKLMTILGVYVCLVCLLIVKSYEYVEKLSIQELNTELINSSFGSTDDPELEDIGLSDDGIEMDEELTDKEIEEKYTFANMLPSLKKINKETVGYLKINGTNIAYPVVQHSDNSYYLKHDFYKKRSSMGWIYLDYRNSKNKFDDNSIIYGHSMLNGTMFGTLHKVLNSSFRKDESNMIISYSHGTKTYLFRIFAGYRVDYTTDYLKTSFKSKSEFNKYVKLIRGRSVFNSSQKVNYGDKILTLSTCTGSGNRRLVVHAVLIGSEEE